MKSLKEIKDEIDHLTREMLFYNLDELSSEERDQIVRLHTATDVLAWVLDGKPDPYLFRGHEMIRARVNRVRSGRKQP